MVTWQDIPSALQLVAAIFTVGATFGLYVRRGWDQDRWRESTDAKFKVLFDAKKECEDDRRSLSERIIKAGGPGA